MANYKGYKYLTSVAGVKFANSPEDGGELRQAILSRLTNGDKKNEYTLILDLKPSIITTQRGVREDAIKVMAGSDCIGSLPRKDIALISTKGMVNGDSNYCFGEGGAGTFSDGKLTTNINSDFSMKKWNRAGILRIKFGTPQDLFI